VEEFLSSYPRLRTDVGYVGFLMNYSGAVIEDAEGRQFVDIFGFSDVSSDIIEIEGDVVDEYGFLIFAQCMYHDIRDGVLIDSYEYDFAYNVGGSGEFGVYCGRSTLGSRDTSFQPYCGNFLSWLQDLVAVKGWFERPTFG